ncbi:CsbD family protein [Xylophilus sp. Kf1]|nr:CsbD family protein [Xylophilus sp. Kf1]
MNKHQVEGRLEQAKGAVKEVAGKAVGNERLEGEGAADKAAGKTEASYGDAKEKVKDSAKKTIDKL